MLETVIVIVPSECVNEEGKVVFGVVSGVNGEEIVMVTSPVRVLFIASPRLL